MTKVINPMSGKVSYASIDGIEHPTKEEADKANQSIKNKTNDKTNIKNNKYIS